MPFLMSHNTPLNVSGSELREMRGWLEDCGARCIGRTDIEIVREVERQYEGGVREFLRVIRAEVQMHEPSACDPSNDPSAFLQDEGRGA